MRLSNRAVKEERSERFKVKEAIKKNNKEGARYKKLVKETDPGIDFDRTYYSDSSQLRCSDCV